MKTEKELLEEIKKEEQKLAAIKQRIASKKSQISAAKRKADSHQKIVLGGAVLSVLGRSYQPGDEDRLIAFLISQENRGSYFSNAMNFNLIESKEEPDVDSSDRIY